MTHSKPTEHEVEELLAAEKLVGKPLACKVAASGYRMTAEVYCPQRDLWLRLLVSVNRTNHSFSLLYNNHRIRGYTKHFQHTNPDGETIRVPHKHAWRDDHDDRWAYVPQDIDPNSDIDTQLDAFCRECNITLLGPRQKGLEELRK